MLSNYTKMDIGPRVLQEVVPGTKMKQGRRKYPAIIKKNSKKKRGRLLKFTSKFSTVNLLLRVLLIYNYIFKSRIFIQIIQCQKIYLLSGPGTKFSTQILHTKNVLKTAVLRPLFSPLMIAETSARWSIIFISSKALYTCPQLLSLSRPPKFLKFVLEGVHFDGQKSHSRTGTV